MKAPSTVCENRTAITEDAGIQLTIRKPSAQSTIVATTNIRYDVSSPKAISSVRVLVDDVNVGEYSYNGKINLSDIKKITIPGSP